MKESSSIAHTYADKFLAMTEEGNPALRGEGMHMHIPEGATPKDGPSAGCAMTTSLLSYALNKPVRNNLAMTGEITLTGKVLPVGGIKEKTIAAKRSGIDTIILPIDNKKDFDELQDYIKEGMDVHYADYYRDVYDIAFGDVDAAPRVL
jgi:Lon-like ATP-dependent protease